MPKLVFFCGLDACHEIRNAVLISRGEPGLGRKTLQTLAKRLTIAESGPDYLAVSGESNERKEWPWLFLTDVNLSKLDPGAIASVKTEMARLLTYSDCLKPHSSAPKLIIQEDLASWEQWFRHLPAAALSQKPIVDPLGIRLRSPVFLVSLAAILIALSYLCVLATRTGLGSIEFACYIIKLLCIAGLLIGTLILPVFGALTEQTRTLSIAQVVLFLSFQAAGGNLGSVEGIANTLVKAAVLFTVSAGIGKMARLSHGTIFQAALVQGLSTALGIAAVIWVLAFSLF